MSWWTRLTAHRERDRALDAELQDHLERQIAHNLRRGLPPSEARRQAFISIGGLAQVKERVRDEWRPRLMGELLRDMRLGGRLVRRSPVYAGLVLVTLSLAVGANVAVLTLVNAVWLRPRPVTEPDRVVVISNRGVEGGPASDQAVDMLKPADLVRMQALPVLESVAGQVTYAGGLGDYRSQFVFSDVGHRVETLAITTDYFVVLGVPIRGRSLGRHDDGATAPAVAIISDRLWRRYFAGREDIIGRTVETSHVPLRIVGVAVEGFHGARLGEQFDVWIPWRLLPRVNGFAGLPLDPGMTERFVSFSLMARLRPGVSVREAGEAVEQLSAVSGSRSPLISRALAEVYSGPERPTIDITESGILTVVGLMAGLVLLAGCATLAALVLVHYERRRFEFAVRLALGGSRSRLIRQLATELSIPAVVGTVLALLVAFWSLTTTASLTLPSGIDLSRVDLGIDWRVMGGAVSLSAVTMAVAALVPLARFTKPQLLESLTNHAATTPCSALGLRRFLLGAHVAVTAVILITAGLFVRTVVYGFTRGPGFDIGRVVFVDVQPGMGEFHDPAEGDDQPGWAAREQAAYTRLVEEFRSLPGVASVGHGSSPLYPMQSEARGSVTLVTGNHEREVAAAFHAVGPGYVDAVGLELVAGRDFRIQDPDSRITPAIVSESLSATLWPRQSPLGQRFARPAALDRRLNRPARIYEVVGVVSDFLVGSVRWPAGGAVLTADRFRGFVTVGTPAASLAVGTNTDAEVLKPQIRTLAAGVFPRAARVDVNTGTDLIERDLGRERLGAWFFSGFGLVTLGLGLGGIFGLVAYVVNLRRREIGIRMALGATRSRVLRSVMAWSLFPAVAGLTAGLAGSLLVGRSVESYVHGISSLDPATYAGTVIVIAVGAASAGLLAAVGIYRLNPVEALRSE